jgi:predicted MFS family arabinose efflux permease
MLGPLQEAIRLSLSLTDNQIALLQGPALAFPVIVASVPLGLLVDRYSGVRLLRVLALGMAIGCLLTAVAPSYSTLLWVRCLVGLAALSIVPVILALVSDIYAPSQRGRAMMVIAIAQLAGSSGAFALAGGLLATDVGGRSWRIATLALAAPVVMVAASTWLLHGASARERTADFDSETHPFLTLWRNRSVVGPLLCGVFMAETAVSAALIWTGPAMARGLGISMSRASEIVAAALLISGLIGPVVGGYLADICQRGGGPRRTAWTLIGLTLVSAPEAAFVILPDALSASVTLVIYITLVSAICVIGATLFTIVVPSNIRGLCISIMSGAGTLAFGIAPLLVSTLSSALGGPAMIARSLAVTGMCTILLTAACFACALPQLTRRVERI